MRERGARRATGVVGVDPSLDAIRAARRVAEQLGVEAEYVVADARHLPFADASFDVVFSYSVFQHFAKRGRARVVRRDRPRRRAGGRCRSSRWRTSGALRSLANQARERRFREPRTLFDVRYWSPGELRDAFARAVGPTEIAVDGFLTLNPQPADLAPAAAPLPRARPRLGGAAPRSRGPPALARVRRRQPLRTIPPVNRAGGRRRRRASGSCSPRPLLAAAAVAVKLEDGGPVLYRQRRVGLGGEEFELLKLRTMVVGAETKGAGYAVDRGDSRITRVGRVLRRLSLDELPQLCERPARRHEPASARGRRSRYQVERYTPRQRRRLEVRPGLTGWAQIHGRASLPWEERIELDVWYVDHRSPLVDLKILLADAARPLRRHVQGRDRRLARPRGQVGERAQLRLRDRAGSRRPWTSGARRHPFLAVPPDRQRVPELVVSQNSASGRYHHL